MMDRYYEASNCYYMSSRKRRRILRKRIRSACNIIIGICAFNILGIVGSVDIGELSLAGFFFHETITISILIASIWVKENV